MVCVRVSARVEAVFRADDDLAVIKQKFASELQMFLDVQVREVVVEE